MSPRDLGEAAGAPAAGVIGRLVALFSLVRGCFAAGAAHASIKPKLAAYVVQVEEMARSVKAGDFSPTDWQVAMESLYARIPLRDLLQRMDFDALAMCTSLPGSGELFDSIRLPGVDEGRISYYTFLAGLSKGRAIPPHAHYNLVSAFLVLKGKLHGRHFSRVTTTSNYIEITPTIDRMFNAGDFSTVSQERDDIHWFVATTDDAYILDIGVAGLAAAKAPIAPRRGQRAPGRIYLEMPRTLDEQWHGTVRAQRISEKQAYQRYG